MILVKFPSRERPDQFASRLRALVDLCDNVLDLHFVFTFDANDETMHGMAKALEQTGLLGQIHFGHSKSKIDAVNRDMDQVNVEWDILLLMSDDMVCQVKGWDTIIKEDFAKHFPDGDGAMWYFDGFQKDICTLPVIGRKYYDHDGYIYHPSYRSVWCDNEQTAVAQERGKMVFSETVLFQHVHPATVTGVIPDKLHTRNELAWHVDQKTFMGRKAKGFPK